MAFSKFCTLFFMMAFLQFVLSAPMPVTPYCELNASITSLQKIPQEDGSVFYELQIRIEGVGKKISTFSPRMECKDFFKKEQILEISGYPHNLLKDEKTVLKQGQLISGVFYAIQDEFSSSPWYVVQDTYFENGGITVLSGGEDSDLPLEPQKEETGFDYMVLILVAGILVGAYLLFKDSRKKQR